MEHTRASFCCANHFPSFEFGEFVFEAKPQLSDDGKHILEEVNLQEFFMIVRYFKLVDYETTLSAHSSYERYVPIDCLNKDDKGFLHSNSQAV